MRWDKALNLLIAIFLCLNIVLAWINYEKLVVTYQVSDDRLDTITSILKKNNIKVDAKLPRVFSPKSSIWLEPVQITSTIRDGVVSNVFGEDRSLITITKDAYDVKYGRNALVYSKQEEELKFSKERISYHHKGIENEGNALSEKEALKLAKRFVENLEMENYFQDVKIESRSESYGWDITYYEVYKGLPVFDSYIKLRVSEGGVFDAEVRCLVITDKVGQLKPLYPIDEVLFGLQELNLDQTERIVESVELGYRLDNIEGMHILAEEAVPMYKIQMRGLTTPIFVNAYTNTYEEILFISQY
ncbi:two-component system regulatory protein YycI [Niameybacter massiliensis]|uniref:Two-component system regulatory protein YycI n=1 Tax=Holtiella tumoricola TaxID=3018743 RepID=A0AA42DRA7_9FIRM|nr:two-component system regulatory protein YycI [Holtiella tumoricola]MDA3733498.1 two-component system regulatory protein YycI [Holtiella tumoricola]